MPDEQSQGQPTPVEPSPAPVEAPGETPTPQTSEPVPVPEKFTGKSAEEIAAGYLGLEQKLVEQGRELGELRARVSQYQPPQPLYYPQPPTMPEPRYEFDYGKPEESVLRLVDTRLERERQERAMYEVGRQEQEARLNYESGKDAALKSNPRLFEGIEPLVEQAVQTAYRQYGLHPAALRDPKTWERVAVNLRWERGESDRIAKQSVQPPQPSHTAVPNPTRTAKAGIELDDDTRRLAKDLGLSEKEAKEILEREIEGSGR